MSDEIRDAAEWPDTSFEGTWRAQVRRGLAMTPQERLEWLERMRREFSELKGRAKPVAGKR